MANYTVVVQSLSRYSDSPNPSRLWAVSQVHQQEDYQVQDSNGDAVHDVAANEVLQEKLLPLRAHEETRDMLASFLSA